MHFRHGLIGLAAAAAVAAASAGALGRTALGPGPEAWQGDLTPIGVEDWSHDRAAHLLERAGFGGTPEEIARLAAMTPEEAVRHLVNYEVGRQRPPAGVRPLGRPRARPDQLPAEPPGDDAARQGDGRGARACESSRTATGRCSRW